jgi:hypothetical protein
MVVNDRYSSQKFIDLGLDTEESQKLAELLEQDVQEQLKAVMQPEIEALVSELNEAGHQLKLYESTQECIAYYDSNKKKINNREFSLGIMVDFCAFVGYSHLVSNDDEDLDSDINNCESPPFIKLEQHSSPCESPEQEDKTSDEKLLDDFDLDFSFSAFSKVALNHKEKMSKINQLESQIGGRLYPILEEELEKIIAELNDMGHYLRLYDSLAYRDDLESEDGYQCKLRVAFAPTFTAVFSETLLY